jgi:uncharacterized membrane protein YkvA (DUF1232 family)
MEMDFCFCAPQPERWAFYKEGIMTKKFTKEGFWNKLSNYALDAGKDVVRSGLKLYFAAVGKNMPVWAQGVAFAALAYFISPVDAIPDVTPVIGYLDDAGVLATAIVSLRAYITAEVTRQANKKLKEWFG